MTSRPDARHPIMPRQVWGSTLAACCIACILVPVGGQAQESGAPVELDHVVAVVNGRAILASDLNDEIRLSALEPNSEERDETPQEALRRLIARTLIRQQIRDEDEQSLVPTADEVSARIADLRKRLPACVQANCETETGWRAFLDAHALTQQQAQTYVRNRVEVLRFIEQRFGQGVHISPEEVETYYRDTLLPQYPPGQPAPPLDKVSVRIEEILLQQHVTGLFSEWLDNLRAQGDVEVLDSSLESALEESQANAVRANPVQKGPGVQ